MLSQENAIIEFSKGETVELPMPEKSGYIFEGWYDNNNFIGPRYMRLDGKYANSDKEFWAKWNLEEDQPRKDYYPKTYKVTLVLNGGLLKTDENIESYTEGKAVNLPVPEKGNYLFLGWYENADFSGDVVTKISENSTGDKVFYAKWTEEGVFPKKFKITFVLNGGIFDVVEAPTEYTEGELIVLPVPIREGYDFDGWFENENFNGQQKTKIFSFESGDKIFYAKWSEIYNGDSILKISAYGGYEEGAYVEIKINDGFTSSDYKIEYRLSDGISEWSMINSELIRKIDGHIRADVVGIKAGNYKIRINAKGETVILSDIQVSAYDRSGYAHFGQRNNGVGAYNPDGTIKQNAKIIYVTEQTKNSVEAEIAGSKYRGIVNILAQVSKLNDAPLNVRLLGRISVEGLSDCIIKAASNITIEGIGEDAELFQWGLSFIDCNSIEVRNLTFSGCSGNACSFKGNKSSDDFNSKNIWVHNNTFLNGSGEASTYFNGVSDVTIAYNNYVSNTSAEQIKNVNGSQTAYFTIHHNFYDDYLCSLIGTGQVNVHLYNNYYKGKSGNDFFISLNSGVYAFMENCYMQSCSAPPIITDDAAVKIWNTVFNNCGSVTGEGIFIAVNRNQQINYGSLKTDFELNGSNFYYNDNTEESNVSVMNKAEEVPDVVPIFAGVHRNS